jgi:hypothetical protein
MEAADVFRTLDLELKPDPARTVIRPFSFNYPDAFAEGRPTRSEAVAARLMAQPADLRQRMLELLHDAMQSRHRNVDKVFGRRDTARRPMQQLGSQSLLQRADDVAKRGRCYAEAGGRSPEAALLRNRDESP